MQPDQADTLIAALRSAARQLGAGHSIRNLEQALDEIVAAAVDTIPGADAGGISITENGHIVSRSPINDDVRKLDELQSQLHEGPCIAAVESPSDEAVILALDLNRPPDADRWPHFAAQAVGHGYQSLLSTQLSAGRDAPAALNLYSHQVNAFDESALTMASLFGLQATLVLYGANHALQLNKALQSRDLIGQAKGILMERFRVTSELAFQMLVSSSQDTNIKLVEIASWLTETGVYDNENNGRQRHTPSKVPDRTAAT